MSGMPAAAVGRDDVLARVSAQLQERHPVHPFLEGIRRDNFEQVAAEFLGLSVSFPYIQAGAIHRSFEHALAASGDADANTEVTSAVGAFLVWDELGGHHAVRQLGDQGLLQLTRPAQLFHSHMLRRDLASLLGRPVQPAYSPATKAYLDGLLDGLSDARGNRNVANMVAFEQHASDALESLWEAVARVFDVPKDEQLAYFHTHVGGDSPAEAVHVELTQRMVDDLVADDARDEFVEHAVQAYDASIRWCRAIV